MSETPLCEISVSCDNLLCDSHGRAPTAKVVVHTRNFSSGPWLKYACTEMAEVQIGRSSFHIDLYAVNKSYLIVNFLMKHITAE